MGLENYPGNQVTELNLAAFLFYQGSASCFGGGGGGGGGGGS